MARAPDPYKMALTQAIKTALGEHLNVPAYDSTIPMRLHVVPDTERGNFINFTLYPDGGYPIYLSATFKRDS